MRTFAELLREYTTRTGISDAELARTLGVRRQTVFRWKEGLVARPRSPEDVLRCAQRLRLTPEERDELLLAAGFPPQAPLSTPIERQVPPADVLGGDLSLPSEDARPVPAAEETTGEIAPAALSPAPIVRPVEVVLPPFRRSVAGRRLRWVVLAAGMLLLAAAVLLVRSRLAGGDPVARPGETLIVVGQFANYAGGGQGYNVAGRVQEALEREIKAANLMATRAAVWPGTIGDEAAAGEAGQRSHASLVIWGEYDSGRVLAHLTAPGSTDRGLPQYEKLMASPSDLAPAINSTLPEEVRCLALLTLGQLYLERLDYAAARAVLTQAQARPPADPIAQANLYALLGYAYQDEGPGGDLDQAILYYSRALDLAPSLVSAQNNRGIAYLRRGQPGDEERAVADLDAVVTALPDDATAYVNRGAAYLQMGNPAALAQAVADFTRCITLAPDAVEGYFNRGLAYVRLQEPDKWRADFERTLALQPDHAGAHNALCWAYGLDRQAEQALPYCERAVALEPDGAARDNRGIVYAQLGRYAEAVADIEAYLQWLHQHDEAGYREHGPAREAWVAALRAGRNPFDATTLEQLRQEQ